MEAWRVLRKLTGVFACSMTLVLTAGTPPSLQTDTASGYPRVTETPDVATYSVAVPSLRYEFDRTIYLYQHQFPVSTRGERIRIWRSTDDGNSWNKVLEYVDRYRVDGTVVVGLPAPGRDAPTVYLHFHHGVPGVYELWRSLDGGDTWETGSSPGWSGSSCTSPTPTNSFGAMFSACGHYWIYNDIGVERSLDNGSTWNRVWSNTGVYQVATSPNFAADHTVYASIQLGYEPPPQPKLIASYDGGNEWEARDLGLCEQDVSDIALSPAFAQDQTVFISQGNSIQRSRDGGVSWHVVYYDGLSPCLDRTTAPMRLFPSPDYANDRVLYRETSGLYVSSDDGQTWWLVSPGYKAAVYVRRQPAIVRLPRQSRAADVLSSAASPMVIKADTNLSQVFLPLVQASGLSPLALTIFASSGTPHRSDDGGVTWTRLSLPPAAEVYLPLIFAAP